MVPLRRDIQLKGAFNGPIQKDLDRVAVFGFFGLPIGDATLTCQNFIDLCAFRHGELQAFD